jgi:hypothetical protein
MWRGSLLDGRRWVASQVTVYKDDSCVYKDDRSDANQRGPPLASGFPSRVLSVATKRLARGVVAGFERSLSRS